VANINLIELNRLESAAQAAKVVMLIEREGMRKGIEKDISGQVGALRDIHAAFDRLALDVIETIRSRK